jgi:threonine dehydratase
MREVLAREHLVTEGAGAAAVAAVMAGRIARPGTTVAVVVSGANVDLARLREILADAS